MQSPGGVRGRSGEQRAASPPHSQPGRSILTSGWGTGKKAGPQAAAGWGGEPPPRGPSRLLDVRQAYPAAPACFTAWLDFEFRLWSRTPPLDEQFQAHGESAPSARGPRTGRTQQTLIFLSLGGGKSKVKVPAQLVFAEISLSSDSRLLTVCLHVADRE